MADQNLDGKQSVFGGIGTGDAYLLSDAGREGRGILNRNLAEGRRMRYLDEKAKREKELKDNLALQKLSEIDLKNIYDKDVPYFVEGTNKLTQKYMDYKKQGIDPMDPRNFSAWKDIRDTKQNLLIQGAASSQQREAVKALKDKALSSPDKVDISEVYEAIEQFGNAKSPEERANIPLAFEAYAPLGKIGADLAGKLKDTQIGDVIARANADGSTFEQSTKGVTAGMVRDAVKAFRGYDQSVESTLQRKFSKLSPDEKAQFDNSYEKFANETAFDMMKFAVRETISKNVTGVNSGSGGRKAEDEIITDTNFTYEQKGKSGPGTYSVMKGYGTAIGTKGGKPVIEEVNPSTVYDFSGEKITWNNTERPKMNIGGKITVVISKKTGKPVGGTSDRTPEDIVRDATREQLDNYELREMYVGTIANKGKVSGDGDGTGADATGMAALLSGGDELKNVLIPSNDEIDRRLQMRSRGAFNPKQLTEKQRSLYSLYNQRLSEKKPVAGITKPSAPAKKKIQGF